MKGYLPPAIVGLVFFSLLFFNWTHAENYFSFSTNPASTDLINLPEPKGDRDENEKQTSIETALQRRRSIREYGAERLELKELSRLLWAAQGVTDPRGFRTAPSAGALYPLELYLTVENVADLEPGLYLYHPEKNGLETISRGEYHAELAGAALGQQPVERAAANLLFGAIYERIKPRYGDRAVRYTDMEIGHAAQNVYLQAVSLELGTVSIGAFDESRVTELLDLPAAIEPRLLMPVGGLK